MHKSATAVYESATFPRSCLLFLDGLLAGLPAGTTLRTNNCASTSATQRDQNPSAIPSTRLSEPAKRAPVS